MSDPENSELTRRELLISGAGGVVAGGVASDADDVFAAESGEPDVYSVLGVRRIINAAGTITTLGGSLMPPEVTAAWKEASKSFVSLIELQDRIGERIAKLLDCEAALVTTGAAGGIVVGTAAAVTFRDHSLIAQLPLPPERGIEVIRQKSHRECYDHQVMACGVKLVDVETPGDLERAISDRTAMMLSYNVQEGESTIARKDWIRVARQHSIPTLIDAAADTPPLSALSDFTRAGYDLVVFSGGKGIRGPQDAGLLLGRKDLIETAKLNTAPRCSNIGRGMKVSKEDMVAMWAAVERFVKLDHAAEEREWNRRIDVIERALSDIPTARVERITPPLANRVPHALVHWDESRISVTPAKMKTELAAGDPSIATARVHGTGDKGFLISVFMLQPGEEEIVAARVRDVLKTALKT